MFKKDKKYQTEFDFTDRVVLVDLEATCDTDNTKITMETIEIGAKDTNGLEFSEFIQPQVEKELTDFCKELTTIQQENVDTADSFKNVFPKFMEYCGDSTILSWGEYDKKQLIRDILLNSMDKKYIKQLEKNHVNLKHYYMKVTGINKTKNIPYAMRRLGLEFDGTLHRGIDDARNLQILFNKLQSIEKEKRKMFPNKK